MIIQPKVQEVPNEVINILESKYNVLGYISFLDIDNDFEKLKSLLLSIKTDSFNPNDRLVIIHMDTDFYFPECSVGLTMKNFFTVVSEIDIPISLFLFYTNHFGIKKEIEILSANSCFEDRPQVIETLWSSVHYHPGMIHDVSFNCDEIRHNALCMLVTYRSHRNALVNLISDIPSDRLALNTTPIEEVTTVF